MNATNHKSKRLKVTGKHKCTLCPYSTNSLGHYKDHAKIHSSEKPFKCPECPYSAKWKSSIKIHLKNVRPLHCSSPSPSCPDSACKDAGKEKSNLVYHAKLNPTEKTFSCSHENCSYTTNFQQSLIKHNRVHTGEKPFVCQFESCSFAGTTTGHLVRHFRTHTKERPFKCPEPNCSYSAADQGNLKEHQLTQHPKEGEERPTFKCPLCEYSAKRKTNLSNHIKTHTLEKLFKCDEPNCNYEAKTKGGVKQHKSLHSDKKPFECSVKSCRFRCKTKASLSVHSKTVHSDERRYKCELCPFRGKTKSVVSSHIKYVHAGSDYQPFKCTATKCSFASKTRTSLKLHTLIHKGDKKYSCPFPDCDYKAILPNMVRSHQNHVHKTGEQLKCSLCGYAVHAKGSFNRHMKTHKKETL